MKNVSLSNLDALLEVAVEPAILETTRENKKFRDNLLMKAGLTQPKIGV